MNLIFLFRQLRGKNFLLPGAMRGLPGKRVFCSWNYNHFTNIGMRTMQELLS